MSASYLPAGLPAPQPFPDGLDRPFWDGLRRDELLIQRCQDCQRFQWLPEWLCHRCHSTHLEFATVAPHGTVYSWYRAWNPRHPALAGVSAYLVVLVALAEAPGVRLVGNLLGDPMRDPTIGAAVCGVFEHHPEHSLLQWRLREGSVQEGQTG